MRTTLARTLGAVAAFSLALGATFLVAQPREAAAAAENPMVAQLLPIGTEAPDWTLNDGEGKAHSLADYHGKVVLIDFWATWCGPCKQAMPGLQKMYDEHKDQGLVVLGVSTMESSDSADPAGWAKKQGYSYPILVKGEPASNAYRVRALPTFYVVGRDGTIVFRGVGADGATKKALQEAVATALAAPAPTR